MSDELYKKVPIQALIRDSYDLRPIYFGFRRLQWLVAEMHKRHNISKNVEMTTMFNLSFLGNCLAGEMGEMLNVLKKIIRDGESEEKWRHFGEEGADVLIYLAIIAIVAGIDFDGCFDSKIAELEKRWLENPPSTAWSINDRAIEATHGGI